jgi:hypothetical protein
MATYSLIQYDVLKNVMYFKGTPTPDIESYIEDGGFSNESNQDLIQSVVDEGNSLVPSAASTYIINYINSSLPEIDLNNAISVTLNLTIIVVGIREKVDKIYVTSFNTDGTRTYTIGSGLSFPDNIVAFINPIIKFPPLAKCRNCLKFTFQKDHTFNFVGNLGGQFNPTLGNAGFINGQKAYSVTIPDYSVSPTDFVDYLIFWKPGVNFSGTDYNGAPFTVTGNRWVANPVSNGTGIINSKTFFHVLSGSSAPCAYTPPVSTWYNYFGTDGFFLLENPDPIFSKICPDFYHYPTSGSNTGSVSYNCSDGGCVQAASGSTGQYATLEDCLLNCDWPGTGSGYDCTPNGCVISTGSGMFATLIECEAVCIIDDFPTSCSCNPLTNLAINGEFLNGGTNWVALPTTYTPGVGNVSFTGTEVLVGVENVFNSQGTSSVSLTQTGILQPSCSYDICFQAWTPGVTNPSCSISIATGNPSLPAISLPLGNLTSTPTAFTLTIDPIYTSDLTFYFGLTNPSASLTRINIDGICVTNVKCPPPTPSSSIDDCFITGSVGIYEEIEYDCICPEGYISDGSGSCVSLLNPTVTVANAGITSSTNINNGDVILGFSVNQPDPSGAYTLNFNNPSDIIPPHTGIAQPILYYDWNFNGTGNSSTNNSSSFSGSSYVYNTQYTFDILKNDFWYQPSLGQNCALRWVTQLVRNTTLGIPMINGGNYRWSGFGATINVPSPKTYYIGIIGQGAMKIKLDGTTILCTSPNETYPGNSNTIPSYSEINYPAYAQSGYARNATNGPFGSLVVPPPLYGFNPHITSPIQGAYVDFNFSTPGPEYPDFSYASITQINYGKFFSGYNLYIYPVTMSAGCHKLNFEACPDEFKYCSNFQGTLGAIILDNTAEQLVSASSYNDLNIVWDSTYLDPITQSMVFSTTPGVFATQSYYLYTYDIGITPSASAYSSWCPTGSVPAGGNPCNGCISSGSISLPSLPCGSCLECVNGILYNGYVVDKGGFILQGRGPGGIVNTDVVDNPINTWVIPGETEWNNLITSLNGGTTPSTTTGALGTNAVGGKLKDYTRDLTATCWENPNIGAQTDANASGWAGAAGGKRLPVGTYEGLGFEGIWWSANSNSPTPYLYTRELKHYSSDVFRNLESKNHGFSIRLCRPVETGETNGDFITDAYVDNNGTIYDGVVLGDYVWITKNLSDTLYNDATSVVNMINTTNWFNATSTGDPYFAYYDNNPINTNILVGNFNPVTSQCYEFPTYYVYRSCESDTYIIQTESGSTTTPGDVQKDSNGNCWSFLEETNGNPNFPASSVTNYTGNYFSGSNVVYNDCEECQAIHTIYMSFNTKNC